MRKNLSLLIIFLLVLGALPILPVMALDIGVICGAARDEVVNAESHQRQQWFDVNSDLLWNFYVTGYNNQYVSGRYSDDGGETWTQTSEGEFFKISVGLGADHMVSTWHDGTYIHFFATYNNNYLKYRRGVLESDGSITWSAADQSYMMPQGNGYYITGAVDDYGYFYVAMQQNSRCNVYKNDNNDGTWALASGFPHAIELSGNGQAIVQPLGDDDMMFIQCYGSEVSYTVYDGSSWGSETPISSDLKAAKYFSSSGDGDGDVFLCYLDTSNDIKYYSYDGDTSLWSAATTLEDANIQGDSRPVLGFDQVTYDVYIYFLGGTVMNRFWYDFSETEWAEAEVVSDILSNLVGNYEIQCMAIDGDDQIGVVWTANYEGGVNDWFAYWLNDDLDPMRTYSEPFSFELSADLEDVDDDGADWVFTDWKYYTFTITANLTKLDNASIAFVVPTGEENIMCGFWSDGDDWAYASNMSYESREGEPCVLKSGSWNETAEELTFPVWFESRILDVWDPSDNVDVLGSYNASEWFSLEDNFFRIYSKGGFEMNFASTGAAGKLDGGTPFSLYGNNGSIVYNEIWYRDGQHIKLMPDIHFLTGKDEFYVRYGVDYSLGDGEWLQGWKIHINPKFVSYTGIFAANVWINMTNLWYGRTEAAIYTEDLYMFYHGSVSGEGDPGHWKSWLDLWFSDKNASRVGAGRYNAYEFPMIDSADLWLRWLANNWGVKDNVLKEMSLNVPLLDADNSTVISSEQIKMMRFWCELEVDDADGGQYVSIENYEAFDITHSRDLPLVGMSDPVFDETLIPTIGQKGILGALWSMFAGLGSWLSENLVFGGLNLWGTFVNFLDTIAGLVGFPKFFTNLFAWISEGMGYVYLSFEYVLSITSDIFSLMGSLLAAFLTTMGDIITSFVNTITMFTDMMGGAYGTGVDLWETFGISQWITVAIIFYPLYLVILWDQEGMDAVLKQLTLIFGILSWLFGFFVQLIQFTIGLITTIIESIPVAE